MRSFLLNLVAVCSLGAAEPRALRAGAGAVDVSPVAFPVNMPGGFDANPAEGVNDPLMSRSLAISDGETTVVLTVVDNLGLPPAIIAEAKKIASDRTGVPIDRMLVSSTHTHSGAGVSAESSPGSDSPAEKNRAVLVAGLAESIVQAHATLRPASVAAASRPLPHEVFNRRWYLKEGKMQPNPFGGMDKVKMNPPNSPDVLDRPAGPTDPEISMLSVRDARGRPLGLFANYSLHYVGAVPRGKISADYYGEFARLVPQRLGQPGLVAMMSNGTSGDINNSPFGTIRPPREPMEQVRIVAQEAADSVWFALRDVKAHEPKAVLGMRQRTLTLKYRRPTQEQVLYAKAVLAIKDEAAKKRLPRLAEAYARRPLAALERKEETVDAILQVVRIGDFAIVGIPFETFAEIGLSLKKDSPFARTMVVGLANGRHGYLPTPAQHELGGYETWLGTCHVQEDASELIMKELRPMLAELHGL
ncbi:MAG: neutral/alkaline non-lysosomal ceramidase N-terminal domain-containing protein [Opitutales bacterium]